MNPNDPRLDTTNWGADPWRAPTLLEGERMVYSECGRILDNVCYRSHWLMLVQVDGAYFITVRHGAGQERFPLGYRKRVVESMAALSSDDRYLLLYTLLCTFNAGKQYGAHETATAYRRAFVENRLCKRKDRGRATVKVWIEPPKLIKDAQRAAEVRA